jgi:C4-dicarboxylate transporter DctQ subunit
MKFKLGKLTDIGIPIFCGILLLLILAFSFSQIVLRNCFKFSLSWSDEVSQFCMTWLTLFGAIWGIKNNQHMNTGYKLHKKLNQRQINLIDGILALLVAVIAAVVAYQSTIFALSTMDIKSLSLSWVRLGYIFIAMPVSMLVVCYYYLKSFFKNIALSFKKVPNPGLPGQSKG